MGRACSTHGTRRNKYKSFVEINKIPLGIPGRRWEDNTNGSLRNRIGWYELNSCSSG
jgi:hypothetical protein